MWQTTERLRILLSHPLVYRSFQNALGANRARKVFATEYVRPMTNQKILDIGCGPADILMYLPDVHYTGVDLSEKYIRQAAKHFGDRGNFFVCDLRELAIQAHEYFDIIVTSGFLHHIADNHVKELFLMAKSMLKNGGRLITIDPCYTADQPMLAKYLMAKDRGRYVRDAAGYLSLARDVFPQVTHRVRNDLLRIPYTHCILECVV